MNNLNMFNYSQCLLPLLLKYLNKMSIYVNVMKQIKRLAVDSSVSFKSVFVLMMENITHIK